ncbi:iron dependent repressor, metal binding and dimerization domain protein [Demequina sp. NBRC 110053]|uniref:iron dependent repressor, metal binding and dimerization domain protein n=1 Tax=Demequina sp. NBRC 110053 TaxID=1570342 RepID=UPI000A076AD3|nr:iron dependent repressor, metal binding and dimerization domain protein [Demequina sp. NBRC 110053]
MSDLVDTTEMYLRTIYELIEDGVVPMRARIAEQLGHSGPTVSQTIARMERDGLVRLAQDRHLELTDEGEATALRVMRKHRLAERLLVDVIGLELPYVHDEACRWEHVMSERVERRLLELLHEPRRSPYGNPIPALDELGLSDDDTSEATLISLEQAADEGVSKVTLVRIGENPQAASGFLEAAVSAGVVPGATVTVSVEGGRIAASTGEQGVSMTREAARHLFGTPDLEIHHELVT